jgi:hypothetical protein
MFTSMNDQAGNTKGGGITVPFTSCLTGLDQSVLQIKTKIVICRAADSKPVKQEVNGTVILPPLVFPGQSIKKENVTNTSFFVFRARFHKNVYVSNEQVFVIS